MPRYIDADALKHELCIRQHMLNADSLWKTLEILDAQPTADVAERKKGTWINDDGLYRCSSCNMLWAHWWASAMPPERLYKEMKYCPRCGAEMREEKTDE